MSPSLPCRSLPEEKKTNCVLLPLCSPYFITTTPTILSKRSCFFFFFLSGKRVTYHYNIFRTYLFPEDLVQHRRSCFTFRPCTNRSSLHSEIARCEIKEGQMYIYFIYSHFIQAYCFSLDCKNKSCINLKFVKRKSEVLFVCFVFYLLCGLVIFCLISLPTNSSDA